MDTSAERAVAKQVEVDPWPGGRRDDHIRFTPDRVTGRRIRQPG